MSGRPRLGLRARAALALALAALVTGGALLLAAYLLVDGPLRTALDPADARAALADLRGDLLLVGAAWVLGFGVVGWVAADALRRRLGALGARLAAVGTPDAVAGGGMADALGGSRDELRDLAEVLDALLARLASAGADGRRVVAQATHELRRPLTVIRTEVDVTLADPDASRDELRAMGEVVLEAVDRCEALVASLLTLARGEAGAVGEEPCDLARAARTALGDAAPEVRRRRIEVAADLSPAPVRGDRRLLERLAANLVDNAVVHNRQGGRARVETGTDARAGEAWLRVRADGPVVASAEVAGLLEPFARGPGAGEGTGLGLSIVRAVARAHGGAVALRARPEGGLEAEVRLPLRAGVSSPGRGDAGGAAASPSRRAAR